MADYIRPTPRNKIFGLLSDATGGLSDFMEHKDGSFALNGISKLLGIKSVSNALNDLSYGGSIGTGKGMTWSPKPEMLDAAMAAAPVIGKLPAATNALAAAAGKRLEAPVAAAVDRIMASGGTNAAMLKDMARGSQSRVAPQKFRIDDVFGDGNRLDHYDEAKGVMYSQQKLPNGREKWTAYEIYPDTEGGNQVLGEMLKHNSLDEAMKSVRGSRISQTLKTNNTEKYGNIPSIWKGEAKKIAKSLIDSGENIERFGNSTQSASKYLYLSGNRKVRIADHDLPSSYDAADFDYRYGGDIQSLISRIKQERNGQPLGLLAP